MNLKFGRIDVPYLIGTDEAGYGPNLGPLTVCGTLWKIPEPGCDLYHSLGEIVTDKVTADSQISICDSKAIYSAGSIKKLETSVLAILKALSGKIPRSIQELGETIGFDVSSSRGRFDWSANEVTIPLAAQVDQIQSLANSFAKICLDMGIQLVSIECQAIFPSDFNTLVSKYGNKAEVLSSTTLGIARSMMGKCDASTKIVCDKHGGRSKYCSMLNQYLTNNFVQIEKESRELSVYRWYEKDYEVQIDFQSKAESHMPTALASMIAKYFREVSMEIWNRFWTKEIPGIKPTRGYPVDAKRFKSDIYNKQLALGITDESIWRSR